MFRLLLTLSIISATLAQRSAVVHLQSTTVSGDLVLTEVTEGVSITGTLTGLPNGKYGFHVHELGDISTCDATGPHFDPEAVTHGGPDHAVRHVGDLGNVEFTNGVATVNIVDSLISLRGRNSVLGRAFVVHEAEDDLGLGGHELSLTTGNAGARVVCGVIGLKSSDDWEDSSALTSMPSMLLLLSSILFLVYRLRV